MEAAAHLTPPLNEPAKWPSLALSAAVHLLLIGALFLGVQWKSQTPASVEVEVWRAVPAPEAPVTPEVIPEAKPEPPRPPRAEARPEPRPEAKPEPRPAPKPEPRPQARPEPKPEPRPVAKSEAKPEVKAEPRAPVKPQIAVKEQKKPREQPAREEVKSREPQKREEPRARETPKKEEPRAKEPAKKEEARRPEPKAKEPPVREEPRIQPERRPSFDDELRRETQQLQQEKAAREQRTRAEAEARQLRQLEAERAAARNQRALNEYIDRVRGKIRGNITLPPNIPGNPEAVFEVTQLPSGEVLDVKVRRSSGNPALDSAVERAIRKSSPLPKPAQPELFERVLKIPYRPHDD
ncbi:cell envelope integrity protein TolA [Accumulibacter sp.]|uniref:cell envelope integrity protein TolA n=1 Tax=Accumulibacter sp. TaxID=2053492 RepID=UPI0025DD08CA|nr:cell envelope integrity protein TolA [Accumulibacter sp.]MCM8596297.1 cell envelope integrity protein TolA [Accumulibacter sp.]MCM8624555.1 cell envelope integrity protein TolA [Accumulibacter sp.]MDS4050446.1 cell envelope integrity protein TolA [Accumulibacter sp.]